MAKRKAEAQAPPQLPQQLTPGPPAPPPASLPETIRLVRFTAQTGHCFWKTTMQGRSREY